MAYMWDDFVSKSAMELVTSKGSVDSVFGEVGFKGCGIVIQGDEWRLQVCSK